MDCIIITNFYCYPDGREVLQRDLYFPEERDIMELRKKTNWVKGSHGHFAGSVPLSGGGRMSFKEIGIVSHAIAENHPTYKPGKLFKFNHGNYQYKGSVVEFGSYEFFSKTKLK